MINSSRESGSQWLSEPFEAALVPAISYRHGLCGRGDVKERKQWILHHALKNLLGHTFCVVLGFFVSLLVCFKSR